MALLSSQQAEGKTQVIKQDKNLFLSLFIFYLL